MATNTLEEMKVRIGTTLESGLYEHVLQRAKERGLRVNEIFKNALRAYLCNEDSGADYIAESFGSYQVPQSVFDTIVESDIYES